MRPGLRARSLSCAMSQNASRSCGNCGASLRKRASRRNRRFGRRRRAKNILEYFTLGCRPGRRPFDWMSAIQPMKQERNMQYLLMIYSNEAEYAKLDPATSKKMSDEFETFT